jgi:hypothetical protein
LGTSCHTLHLRKTFLHFLKSLKKKTTERSVIYADKTFLPLRRLLANTLRPFLCSTFTETVNGLTVTFFWLVCSFIDRYTS